MSDIQILKAVEWDKLGAQFKKKWANADALVKAGWMVQPKYDGCFGLARISADGPSAMFSRTAENYTPSCNHLLEQLHELADQQSGAWDDFVVLGEVWQPDTPFPEISGNFRRQKPSLSLQFMVHDMLSPDLKTSRRYNERYSNLAWLLDQYRHAQDIKLVPQIIYKEPTILAAAQEYVARGGYDGLVLKDPHAGYSIGLARNGEIVKVKPDQTLDLRITDIKLREGEKTGRTVYVLEVEYRGVKSDVGSGVPHAAADIERGQIAEIECMGIHASGALREPRFKGIRHDKEQPDS